MVNFKPDRDIPDLSGRVIIVTGANVGLGREAIHQLAKHNPKQLYLAARSREKAESAIKEINATLPASSRSIIKFLELDLSDFASVKAAAKQFTTEQDRLDILMNNAGVMACPPGLTKDGYEIQFGTNHMGHALLTKLLLPTLLDTAKKAPAGSVRVVNLSSVAETWAPPEGINFDHLKVASVPGYSTWKRYGQSKLANIYFNRELAKRYPELVCVAVHPGGVNTNLVNGPVASYGSWANFPFRLINRMFMKSISEGVLGQLWAAVYPLDGPGVKGGVKTGTFYWPVGLAGKDSKLARDEKLAARLWDFTERELDNALKN